LTGLALTVRVLATAAAAATGDHELLTASLRTRCQVYLPENCLKHSLIAYFMTHTIKPSSVRALCQKSGRPMG